ncbi:MAG: cytochrome c3 family protein, partial [Planctomycetes bacterium]|nr:cytochrome c3 family protein [Planctomycetota bacterium]
SYNSFSHQGHHERSLSVGGPTLACGDCHQPYDAATSPADILVEGDRPREYATVVYENCLGCHGGAARKELLLEPAWHGAAATREDGISHCLSCHGDLNVETLRQVPDHSADLVYSLVSRSHADMLEVAGPNGKDGCMECHRNAEELEGGLARASAIFEHGTHMVSLQPVDDDGRKRLSGDAHATEWPRGSCVSCHAEMAKTTTLGTEVPHHYPDSACADCHRDALPTVQRRPTASTGETRSDFPHDRHLEVVGGCFACHDFSSESGVLASPVTPDDVKTCIKCHDDHAHVGVVAGGHFGDGTCQKCHTTLQDAEGNSVPDPVWTGQPLAWTRHPDPTFSHVSPGHRAMTDTGDCVGCHGPETWQAKSIQSIPMPIESSPACRKCHVEEKKRFHWR